MVAFKNPIIYYLVIPSGATTGTRIILDGVNGFILVYDASNNLVASLSGKMGTDQYGNTIYPGVGAYDYPTTKTLVQLINGEVSFVFTDSAVVGHGGAVYTRNPHASGGVTAFTALVSPSTHSPPVKSYVSCDGTSSDGTIPASVSIFSDDGADIVVKINGHTAYAISGVAEGWHNITLQNSWVTDLSTPQYKRLDNGYIVFRGSMKNGTTTDGTVLFNMPVGYRMTGVRAMVKAVSPQATAQVPVLITQTNGDVTIAGIAGANASVDLTSLTYQLEFIP